MPITAPPPSTLTQIMQLESMTMKELLVMWQEFNPTPPPVRARSYIERRLAYALQVNALTAEDKKIVAKNTQRIEIISKSYVFNKSKNKQGTYTPVPGTILKRLYNDVEYEVIVRSDGQFEFQKQLYKSLSKIAKEITGTHWSGPAFFGLRKPNTPSKKKK
ncbi:DUF2924 domain-containing protein [Agarilytica rhodophyticola]|uniref:DUF2924 domain-containing protein n=1 Tax=Agarilytica rhodophyticola TaxID=1737490 RepID=UPI0013151D2A|nr:DUF2924 domain-containing protein [Agarilytica rhodophyticola]